MSSHFAQRMPMMKFRSSLKLIRRVANLFRHQPDLWSIPEWAQAAQNEAVARLKHKPVRKHQDEKQRALHKALKGQ